MAKGSKPDKAKKKKNTRTKLVVVFASVAVIISALYFSVSENNSNEDGTTTFQSFFSWEIYDATKNDIGLIPSGYLGATTDGRYVYFTPFNNGRGYHGEILRYDTTKDFESNDAWKTFDTIGHLVGNPVGYADNTFDGRYVYFAPYNNNEIFHGVILRYDTTKDFESVESWETFDPSNNGVGIEARGYIGAVFDGSFVYFVPDNRGPDAIPHAEVLRYDTRLEFQSSESWDTFDAKLNGVGENPVGFVGGVFDGRHVYFSPFWHNEVLRYDTTKDFETVESWETFDAKLNGLEKNFGGYWGRPAFDGEYIYFVPYSNSQDGYHGEVLRYDTRLEFQSSESWQTFDAKLNGIGTNPAGYHSAEFDGRYVYFSPLKNEFGYHGEVLRYDTTQDFELKDSWSVMNVNSLDEKETIGGYQGVEFVGKYLYFVPFRTNDGPNGLVLRYDTTQDFESINSWKQFDVFPNSGSRGYYGGTSDGRYVYFAPNNNGYIAHDKVLRYDTTQDFNSNSAWTHMRLKNLGSVDFEGYLGAIFDNRYVYFIPGFNNKGPQSNFIRYDTQNDFESVDSWAYFNPNSDPSNQIAYRDAEFDGKYLYFSPFYQNTIILRYDTTQDFESAESWKTFGPSNNGVGSESSGYTSTIFDGTFVYFSPNSINGQVLRYDTTQDFEEIESWSTFNYNKLGLGQSIFTDSVFDGKYLYFSPFYQNTIILRYDTTQDFEEIESWSTFYMAKELQNNGFQFLIFDGQYIYLMPYFPFFEQILSNTLVVYDTTQDFHSIESWYLYELGAFDGKQIIFSKPVFDNNVIYFPPDYHHDVTTSLKEKSGIFLKLDTRE